VVEASVVVEVVDDHLHEADEDEEWLDGTLVPLTPETVRR